MSTTTTCQEVTGTPVPDGWCCQCGHPHPTTWPGHAVASPLCREAAVGWAAVTACEALGLGTVERGRSFADLDADDLALMREVAGLLLRLAGPVD